MSIAIKNLSSSNKVKLKKFLSKQHTWLITGAAGFIGSNILDFLLKNNQKIIAIDNLTSGNISNIKELQKKFINKKFIFKKIDIRHKQDLKQINKYQLDYVLHLAALASVADSIKNPNLCKEVNIKGFENLINTVKYTKVKKIIFASSAAVYGNSYKINFESSKLNPMSPYAISKEKNEIYAKKQSKKIKIKFVSLRYFNIFGKNQSSNSGYASVVPKWIKQFRENINIHIYGDGTTVRDFFHVDNVVLANILCAMSYTKSYDVFNVGSGFSITLNDLFKKLSKIFSSKKISLFYKKFKKEDVYLSRSSIKKIKSKLGYKIIKELDPGLYELIQDK